MLLFAFGHTNHCSSQMVCLAIIDLNIYKLSTEFVNITIKVNNVSMSCSSHNLIWYLDIPLFYENFFSATLHSRSSLGGMHKIDPINFLQPFLFDIVVYLVVPQCGGSIWSWRVCGSIHRIKCDFFHQFESFLKLFFRLSRKSYNDICCNGSIWKAIANSINNLKKFLSSMPSSHCFQNFVRSTLRRNVKVQAGSGCLCNGVDNS
mmetsp:Transcript_9391/g.14169  ORF Transcript_9391/g.14169 Transcript_9391/m.14169 type:complete len:205 (-) Transcript_9391:879-1493(-)